MSHHKKFRVLVRTGQIFAIHLAARDEASAIARAERLWRADRCSEFDCVHHHVAEAFDIDHDDECGHNDVVADFCIVDKVEPQSTGTLRFQDLACPRCAHRKNFHIDVGATGYLDASGVCVESDYHWNATSVCTCLGCQYEAPAAEFAKATEVRS